MDTQLIRVVISEDKGKKLKLVVPELYKAVFKNSKSYMYYVGDY